MVSGIKLASKAAFALMAGAMLAVPERAEAVHTNTSGTICNPYNAGQANDIDYVTNGVRTAPGVQSGRTVICAVPRSPLASPQQFYVDGSNLAGQSTSGTLYAYDYNGTFQTSQNFSSSSGIYDVPLSLTGVGDWSYISTLVSLPSNANGVFFGTITIQ